MPADGAGYSHRSLVEKLGIKAGDRIAIVAAPSDLGAALGTLPEAVRRVQASKGPIDVIIFFARDVAGLTRRIIDLKRVLAPTGMLWSCWPKRASGINSDIDESIVREVGLAVGLVDVKVCSVDATWSGPKFVYRLTDRPKTITPRRARRTR